MQPRLLRSFDFNTGFVSEWQPERFLLGVADVYGNLEAKLYEIGICPGLRSYSLLGASGTGASALWLAIRANAAFRRRS